MTKVSLLLRNGGRERETRLKKKEKQGQNLVADGNYQ